MSERGSFPEEPDEPDGRARGRRTPLRAPRSSAVALAALLVVGVVALVWFAFVRDSGTSTESLLEDGLEAYADGRLDDAARIYEDVLEEEPTNTLAHYNLGLVAQAEGRAADAERSYRQALTTDPSYVPALFNLALIRFEAGDLTGAIDLYRQVVLTDPDNAAAHLNLGHALRAAGFVEQGDRSIETAIELDPTLDPERPAPTRTTVATADDASSRG